MMFYLLLVNVGLCGFWLYYHLILRKTTFFNTNRYYLLGAILVSFLIPFIQPEVSTELIVPAHQNSGYLLDAQEGFHEIQSTVNSVEAEPPNRSFWFVTFYLLVLALLIMRLLWGFLKLTIIKNGAYKSEQIDGVNVFYSNKVAEPFSSIKSIYLPLKWYKQVDRKVLFHEKIHVSELHFIDLLLIEIVAAVFWFNPIIYLYKNAIRLNLEYLADRAVLSNNVSELHYQSALLSMALNGNHNSPLTTYFTTPLKNRIEMMKKKRSKSIVRLTIFGCLPIIGLLLAMNTRSEIKSPITAISPLVIFETDKPAGHPIHPSNLKRISAGYGLRKSPFSKKKELHKGIDFVANQGVPIYATAHGVITISAFHETGGYNIRIEHSEVYETQYSHLQSLAVFKGQQVRKGQLIGYVGNTGKSTGPHLHYEVIKFGESVDPLKYIQDGC